MGYKFNVYFVKSGDIGGWIYWRGNPIPIPKGEWVKSKIKEAGKKIRGWLKGKKKYDEFLESYSDDEIGKMVTDKFSNQR